MGSSKPFTVTSRSSENLIPLPRQRSCTPEETTTQPGSAQAHSRAACCTAAPKRSSLLGHRFPRRNPDAEPYRLLLGRVALVHAALDLRRCSNRLERRDERRHDPVAGVLDLVAAEARERGAHDPIVLAQQPHRRLVAELLRHARGVDDVGEEDRAKRAVHVRLARRMGVEAPEEAAHARLVDLDHGRGNHPVGGAVCRLHRLRVGTLDEAEAAAGVFFEPVGHEAHAELVLHLEVAQMRGREVGGRGVGKVVAIHEKRHHDRTLLSRSA